jgi:hypothetical protein
VALARRWADEYNTTFADAEECRRRADRVRPFPLSVMTGFLIGGDEAELRARAARLGADPIRPYWISGTPERSLRAERARGRRVQRVMLQHLLHDDLEAVELAVAR